MDQATNLGRGVDERRRDLLKKAGVAAGAVWAAPVVASSFSPASAQAGSSVCGGGGLDLCSGGGTLQICGSDPLGSNSQCHCIANPFDVCVPNAPCGALAPCVNGTCPPGMICAPCGCGVPAGVCVPICSSGRSADKAIAGPGPYLFDRS